MAESTTRFCQLGVVATLGVWISCIVNDVGDVCQRLKAEKVKVTKMHLTIKIAARQTLTRMTWVKEPLIFLSPLRLVRTWFV